MYIYIHIHILMKIDKLLITYIYILLYHKLYIYQL